MWSGEEDIRIVGQKRLLRAKMLHPHPEDRAIGRFVTKSSKVGGAKRALPHESLVPYSPEGEAARGHLAGLRQRECDTTHVLPAGHVAGPPPSYAPWHFLNFLPLPHQQGSLRPTWC